MSVVTSSNNDAAHGTRPEAAHLVAVGEGGNSIREDYRASLWEACTVVLSARKIVVDIAWPRPLPRTAWTDTGSDARRAGRDILWALRGGDDGYGFQSMAPMLIYANHSHNLFLFYTKNSTQSSPFFLHSLCWHGLFL